MLVSERTAYYASSKKTRVTVGGAKQCLDGDGTSAPFAEPPKTLPKIVGTHTLKLSYQDNPLCGFERKDPQAKSEGNTLVKVDGKDQHQTYLVVGDSETGGLTLINTQGWEVGWYAEINNQANEVKQVPEKS